MDIISYYSMERHNCLWCWLFSMFSALCIMFSSIYIIYWWNILLQIILNIMSRVLNIIWKLLDIMHWTYLTINICSTSFSQIFSYLRVVYDIDQVEYTDHKHNQGPDMLILSSLHQFVPMEQCSKYRVVTFWDVYVPSAGTGADWDSCLFCTD